MILFDDYYYFKNQNISLFDCIVYGLRICVLFCLTFEMSTTVIRANCQHSSTCYSAFVFIDATSEINKISEQKNEFLVQGNSKQKQNGRYLWILF